MSYIWLQDRLQKADFGREQKERIAADEEKKRKRAEKFGTAQPTNGVESEGSVSITS